MVEVIDRRNIHGKPENSLNLIFNLVQGKNLEQHLQKQREKKKVINKELFLDWAL